MIRMQIEKDNPHLENLLYLLGAAGRNTLPNTEAAMKEAAKIIQGRWVDFANGGSLKGIADTLKRPNGGYARSIKAKQIGAFAHEIYSEADIAKWIENGTEELDMKRTHPYGPRSRVSKKTGYPYLIVPFQWGTKEGTARVGPKNIVPEQLLSLMRSKKFKASTVKSETSNQSSNARGEMVNRNTYSWGDRAKGSDFAGTVEQKRLADGMVRFEQGSAADNPKGKRYGGYFTFRIISAAPGAKGWIKPAMPARHVTKAVADETREKVNALIEARLKGDFGK
jgi:hypothetical protein